MKIGLLTRFRPDGYGPPLQAAALSLVTENCELIDYTPESPPEKLSKEQRIQRERCGRFLRGLLPVSGHRFENLAELQSAELPYDLLLCMGRQGSGPLDPARLGGFSSLRRTAYGLSFPAAYEPDARDILRGFSHLSVQTDQERRLLEGLTGRDIPAVLDPLLLPTAEQWSALAAQPAVRGPYLLCDCTGDLGPLGPYITRLAAETGLPVVWLAGPAHRHPKGRRIGDAGPAEALALFQNAAYVCTDSFYGTALSVLFQRPFFTGLPSADLTAPEASRTFALLKPLGLTDRITGKGDAAAPTNPIRWSAVEAKLAEARAYSLHWLNAALENAPPLTPASAPEISPQLADRCRCTGCTACAQSCPENAIAMVRDREGFDYPVIDRQLCTHCGRCEAVCPAGRPRETRHLPAVFAAWNRDDAIRRDSTSGGAFSVLADFVLEGGGVVFGAVMDGHQRLRHTACFSKEELWRLRGSKYVQSELEGTFRMVRECLETRQVLFSGTPCQVDGLCRFLGGRPEHLVTCDLVCRGVSSPSLWADMVRFIETRKGRGLQAVRFCNKVTGWQDSHLTLVYDDGRVDSAPFRRTEFGRSYLRGLPLRPACYTCPYASMTRPGDFTLGNFWGLRPDELPEQREQGVNLLLVNTPHGSHIFDQLPLHRRAFPAERAIAGNPALAAPALQPPDRGAFFAAYALEPFDALRKQYLTQPPLVLRAAGKLLAMRDKHSKSR